MSSDNWLYIMTCVLITAALLIVIEVSRYA